MHETDGIVERAPVGVLGATGYTGSLVCRALAERGLRLVVSARDAAAVTELAAGLENASPCVADARDPREVVRQVRVVILCAGPYTETLEPVLEAAKLSRTHVIHLCCEPRVLQWLFEREREIADAGIAVVGPAGYSTAMGEALTWLCARRLGKPHRLTFATSTSAALPSVGTLRSYLVDADGSAPRESAEVEVSVEPETISLPPPFGPRIAMAAPLAEGMTLPRLLGVREARVLLGTVAPQARALAVRPLFLRDRDKLEQMVAARARTGARGPDAAERSATAFGAWAQIEDEGGGVREMEMWGTDPYGLTAHIAAEAAVALAESSSPGVQTTLQAMDPQRILALLARGGVRWKAR